MIGEFTRGPQGTVAIELSNGEAQLLADLFGSLGELLEEAESAPAPGTPVDPLAQELGLADLGAGTEEAAAVPDDPALARLLPDAYPDDAEASAEFRRYTRSDLAAQRLKRVGVAGRSLKRAPEGGTLQLDPPESAAWLGALNDLRIVIGTRLEITEDGQEVGHGMRRDDTRRSYVPVYQYLGLLQETLVEALSEPE